MSKNLLRTLKLSVLFICLMFTASTFAQLSEGGTPYSFNKSVKPIDQVAQVDMPYVDVQALLAQDQIEQAKGLPFRFGTAIDVKCNINNSGSWETLPNGDKIWRLRVFSNGAYSLNFIFNDFFLPKGTKFFIYNPQKTEVIGAFTSRNNNEDGAFSTGLVRGETSILEYYQPAGTIGVPHIGLSKVIHGYKNLFNHKVLGDDFGGSGSCNININCPQGADFQVQKRAVAVILESDNTRICTGSMINNVRGDLKPYFLTANHCIQGQTTSTWIIMFNYESPTCANIDGPLNYTLQGTQLKANNAASDFALLLLNNQPPDSFKVHWAGWSAIDTASPYGTAIHHPDCDIKKISFITTPFVSSDYNYGSGLPNSHWHVFWSQGVTEPGSSGSPLFDNNKRIVGQLHGGPSSCTASDKSDFYGKFAMSWNYGTTPATRLKDWLDPDNTGRMTLDGYDPTLGTRDTVPPTRIINLAVTNPTSNSLTLTWAAPMDTSYSGVKEYKIVRSMTAINDTNAFNNATLIAGAPIPDSAGHVQSMTITGLNPNTPYYFAIRSRDIWNNWSLVSNSPSGTTWQAPVALVTPASINRQVMPGNLVIDTVSIKNNTTFNSTLDYTVTLANNTFPQGLVNAKIISSGETTIPASKGKQNEKGGTSVLGSGGPDAGGYKWKDSDDPNGPTYVWNDIASTGTQITSWSPEGTGTASDDGFVGPINIGFPVKFYGQLKNQLYISTNGHIDFTHSAGTTYDNQSIPDADAPNDLVAPFWDDLDAGSQGTVHYLAEANKFTVQYTNIPKYNATSGNTFQVVIYKSGKIEYYYKTLSGDLTSCSVGIENADGTIGTSVAYNAAYLKNNFAIRFAAEPDWIAANNVAGRVMNGATAKVQLSLNGDASYPTGTYQMDMIIKTNDPTHDSIVVPVKMVLTSVPVELTGFTAQVKENSIVLNWSTATEKNNAGYSIERKDANKSTWGEVNFVKGNSTTTEISKYSFCDKNLPYGHYSYRLKQVDYDGTTTYSPVVEADVKAPNQYQLSQNYPNPFNPSTTIKFSLPEKANVKLIVYNNLGQQVAEIVNSSMEPGYHQVQFDASKLASGMYIYRLEAGKFSDTKKMTIIK